MDSETKNQKINELSKRIHDLEIEIMNIRNFMDNFGRKISIGISEPFGNYNYSVNSLSINKKMKRKISATLINDISEEKCKLIEELRKIIY